jgi:hypothetical protein
MIDIAQLVIHDGKIGCIDGGGMLGAAYPAPASPETIAWHIAELRKQFNTAFAAPTHLKGDGIVYAADGKYWLMAVVAIRLLRKLGCDLPVQVHFWGTIGHELDDDPLVTLVDQRAHPQYNGFAYKTHAVLTSGFRRVLWLDSDAYCVRDPAPLFQELKNYPYICWTPMYTNATFWRKWTGITKEPIPSPPNGGMWLVDLCAFWKEMNIIRWIDAHADYFYRYNANCDEASVAMVLTEMESKHLALPIWSSGACLYPLNDESYVVHRMGSPYKLWPQFKPRWNFDLPLEGDVQQLFDTLSRGMVFNPYLRSA